MAMYHDNTSRMQTLKRVCLSGVVMHAADVLWASTIHTFRSYAFESPPGT